MTPEELQSTIETTKFPYKYWTVVQVLTLTQLALEEAQSKITTFYLIDFTARAIARHNGYLYPSVLAKLGISSWKDIGNIIFFLVENKVFSANEDDKIEDFEKADKDNPLPQLIEFYIDKEMENISNGRDTSTSEELY